MAVLMGLINTNTLQVIWTVDFPKWVVDRRSRTSEQLHVMRQVVLENCSGTW